MEPLVVLLTATVVVHLMGRFAFPRWRPWPIALRFGVSAMFVTTGLAHFIGMREELIGMVPPGLPAPGFLVTVTGILELAGAVALWWAPTRRWAAGGLALMLLCMFPANVHLATTAANLDWSDTLLPRTVLQAVFLAAVLAVLGWDLKQRRAPVVPDRIAQRA